MCCCLTTNCLRQYIKSAPGKFEAAAGTFDDPVVSCLWAAYAKRIKGAVDMIAVMPQDRGSDRAIAIDKVSDLRPDQMGEVYGPAIVTRQNSLEGISTGSYDDVNPFGGVSGNRSLGGRQSSLEGRRER